jgi:hypothetical protein
MKGIFDSCPLCGEKLMNKEAETRWIHDIVNHRGYWEGQMGNKFPKIVNAMYGIIEYHHGKAKAWSLKIFE